MAEEQGRPNSGASNEQPVGSDSSHGDGSDLASHVAGSSLGQGGNGAAGAPAEGQAAGRRRGPYRDLTVGSIPKNLWFMAWPQTVTGSLGAIDRIWDFFLAGFKGFQGIAGVGAAQQWTLFALMARMGMDISMRAMISRAVGAGDIRMANHVAFQGFTLGIAYFTVVCVFGIILTEFLLNLLGFSDETIALAAPYMRLHFLSLSGQGVMTMLGAALQASGDPITPMKAGAVQQIGHFIFAPLFMFGLWVFPEMGLAGVAMAGLLGSIPAVAMNLYALLTGKSRLHLRLSEYRVDFPLLWRLVRIGTPASITSIERQLSLLAVMWLVTPFGTMAVAAYSIAQRVQMFTQLTSMGFGQGAGVMVGQALGAGNPKRARRVVVWALLLVTVASAIGGLLLFLFPREWLMVFVREQEVIELTVPWVRIVVLGFVVQGTGMVFVQSYNTAGDTVMPMVVSLATIWLVQLPLAVMLSGAHDWTIFGFTLTLPTIGSMGQYGIAWAIVIAMVMRMFFFVPYFFTDRWLRKQVLAGLSAAPDGTAVTPQEKARG